MWLWRNPEIKKYGTWYSIVTLLATCGAGICFGFWSAVYLLIFAILAAILFWCAAKERYEFLSALSQNLDYLLHTQEPLQFVPDMEGELALLSSEIQKLTQKLLEQAEEVQKEKEYLKDSIADISHQIRTPLTSIRLLLSQLQRAGATQEEKRDCLMEIRRLLTRMEWQVSVLLKIARLDAGSVVMENKEVSLEEIITNAWKPLEILAEVKDISFCKKIGKKIFVQGDEGWLVEAVGNLLKNCVEHLQEGGTVWITALQNPLYTEVCIADNGPGISSKELPHIFERFYRGKHLQETDCVMEEHAGIGLALAQKIIREQNGSITAKNRTAGGIEFIIRFYVGAR